MTEEQLKEAAKKYNHSLRDRLALGEANFADEDYIVGYNVAIEEYKKKADKWDALEAEVAKYYCNKDGEYDEENSEEQGDLCDIGEVCASHMGWLQ